jgi:hypothetical protein
MLVIGVLLAGAASSFAETPEQRQACTDAAFQFCQQYIPDRERVFACLIQNKDAVSPLCREALAPYLPPEPAPPPKQASKPTKSKPKTATKTTTKPAPKPSKKVATPLSLNPKAH